jgi:hypothetical protein
MLTRAPLRFLQLYFFRLGFLDGVPGFQICVHTAYYAFLKQAKLWELHHALPQPDVEDASAAASSNDEPRQEVLSFENPAHYVNNSSASQKRRAA